MKEPKMKTSPPSQEAEELAAVELVVSRFLRAGVVLSAVVIGTGLLMFLITDSSGYPDAVFPTGLIEIVQGLMALKPYGIILTGLFLLILTPVLRVAVSLLVFWKQRDWMYMGITTVVLGILIISFFIGRAG
ncbi:DUF1634 domain-containing protein [Paenibacillus larvae]|uniref:DUF1634 domain-containing protein n=4 Tax=Paenibacillus larvae TaxID=1464 RepID=V9W3F9_9BACL|nr:DUF1634 domain-containing protein [Paenibacillus larvae]AHD05566.1 hypothetical protein ERIC2_c17510 [Paenibacillus larvae subsp. larvae DSM 25430]AVF22116.1 putative membrane protein [Paenibacillus larvae subsp. larvae]AVG12119.1 putative membrane protein [Paenibacillus larvae subsp. larvae DSM 25430]ETK27044.1 hypothetical protein ERIC1_1c04840 [Paenibacillus larvae subsp. larvae DSM 25719]MCY7475563.1 DUF1634 domain-containing protein [Paenibacillus larvae]